MIETLEGLVVLLLVCLPLEVSFFAGFWLSKVTGCGVRLGSRLIAIFVVGSLATAVFAAGALSYAAGCFTCLMFGIGYGMPEESDDQVPGDPPSDKRPGQTS